MDVVEDERSGLLVASGDVPGLSAALLAFVTDPARASAMGEAARAVAVTRFDERDSLDRYRALFREVADRTRR